MFGMYTSNLICAADGSAHLLSLLSHTLSLTPFVVQDTGATFGNFRSLSYAETLLEFFSSLSTPIVPPTLFPTLEIDSQNIQSSARRFLEELPPVHYNVFLYVISFFREALVYREMNKLTAAKLARICSNHMAPPSSGMDDSTAAQRRSGMQLIMVHLLETNSI